ncbi:MAG: hypothetical protein IJ829_01025 [Kiritimatiellae bacterium]|nr:hypothetical protein [Kiritimatiellia bacterium]
MTERMDARPETIEELARRIDALALWGAVAPYNWALRPRGTVFPYFCSTLQDASAAVRARLLLIEGWQTFHDFVRTRADVNFGFYSAPMEFAHFELVVMADGTAHLFRHDPCYLPRRAAEAERSLCARLLWECYGVMMRIENDPALPLKFASERAMFARVERADGSWADEALEIPAPRPHVESVSFEKADLSKAKDLPFEAGESVEVDFSLAVGVATREPRPRCVYRLVAVDGATGEAIVSDQVSPKSDGGLRAMWEAVAPRLLRHILARGRIPGEIKVSSQRLFRLLRPLCIELPFKLSLHDSLKFVK